MGAGSAGHDGASVPGAAGGCVGGASGHAAGGDGDAAQLPGGALDICTQLSCSVLLACSSCIAYGVLTMFSLEHCAIERMTVARTYCPTCFCAVGSRRRTSSRTCTCCPVPVRACRLPSTAPTPRSWPSSTRRSQRCCAPQASRGTAATRLPQQSLLPKRTPRRTR